MLSLINQFMQFCKKAKHNLKDSKKMKIKQVETATKALKTLRIAKDLHRKAKIIASTKGISITDFVEKILNEAVSKENSSN
jgi:predicted HicB family RNase H-like nuclease